MKPNTLLVGSSLASIVLMTFHLADDIVRGFEKGGLGNLAAVPTFAIWLYGTLVLADRRSGRVIILLWSLLATGVPILHMRGKGLGGELAKSSGGLFFIWTILAVGVTALLSVVLAARALWGQRSEAVNDPKRS